MGIKEIVRTRDWRFDLGLGHHSPYSTEFMNGVSAGFFLADGVCTIWDAETPWVPMEEWSLVYVTSTNAGDTAVSVIIAGLGEDHERVSDVVNLNGQTAVASNIKFSHVQSVAVITAVEPLGDIYITLTGTYTAGVPDDTTKIQSKINQGNNLTRNGFFKVPRGFVYGITHATILSNNPESTVLLNGISTVDVDSPTTPYALGVKNTAIEYPMQVGGIHLPFNIPATSSRTFGLLSPFNTAGSISYVSALITSDIAGAVRTTFTVGVGLVSIPKNEIRLTDGVES